jgi:thiol-disulfide isomerase/thioredoxin
MLWLVATVAFARMSAETVARLDFALDHFDYEGVRSEAAAALAADPNDLYAHLLYIHAVAESGAGLRRPLRETYRRWLAESPDDPVRRVAMGFLEPLDLGDDWRSVDVIPGRAGPWCDPTLAWLQSLPSDPENRAQALWFRLRVEARCSRDSAATNAAITGLAATTPRARYYAAYVREVANPAIDDAFAADIAAVVDTQPWRVNHFGFLWDKDASGPGLEAARKAVLDAAGTDAASPEVWLSGAAKEFIELRDHAEGKPESEHGALPPLLAARQLLDPAARLAALKVIHPKRRWKDWDVQGYWHARYDADLQVGDDDDAFASLRRLGLDTTDLDGSLQFVRAAVARKRNLGEAASVAGWAVGWTQDPGWAVPSFVWDPYAIEKRVEIADALDARSRVRHARHRDAGATLDAYQATLLDDRPVYHLHLGVAASADGRNDVAFTELSRALSAGPLGDPYDQEAATDLASLYAKQSLWTPAGLSSWLSASEAAIVPADGKPRVPQAMRDSRVGDAFPDLAFTVDGQPRTLSSYPGVVVVDLWASWCLPCKLSLPHVDALAGQFAGRVTVLALSVDAREQDADAHVGSASPGFVRGFLGSDGMSKAGVTGIPAIFVLDGQHAIAGFASGFQDGDHRIDDAVTDVLAR